MFDSLEYELKKQNELFQQILDKGGLGIVIECLEPAIPNEANTIGAIDPYDYDKAKQQISFYISERVAKIAKLHAEIKYLNQFIEERYKYFKQLEKARPKMVWHETVKSFVERYEQEHEN